MTSVADARRVVLTLSICVVWLVIPAGATGWTQFQGDAAHSGHVPVTIDPTGISYLWSAGAAGLRQESLTSGVVTDARNVYVTGYTGANTYQVLALDRLSGAELWRQSFVPYYGSLSAPAVGNGMVYVHQWGHSGISGGNPSQYPCLKGMDAQTGEIKISASHSGQWSSGSRPTIAGQQAFTAGGYYGGLDAYNSQTGTHDWFAKVNQQYGWIPAADDQRVYVYMGPASASPGPYVGTLYAFDRASGQSAFTIQNPSDTFTLYEGTVFVGGQQDALTFTNGAGARTLTSFDLAARKVRWQVAGNWGRSVAIDGDRVFVGNGSELDELDEASGTKLMQWSVPAGRHLTGNVLVTDSLIFAQTDQSTYALDRSTLQPVWSTNTIGDLALGDGVLFISNSSSVTAFAVPEPSISLALAAFVPLLLARRRSADA